MEGDGETMTMRRISVLLVGVLVAMMLTMGTALAHSGNHTVCHVKNGKDETLRGLTHKQANRHINNHPKDYRGACDDGGGGGGVNIGKVTYKAATSPWR
jgi:hypothetical protein